MTDGYTKARTDTLLGGKADTSHAHATSDVTGLSEAIDDRVAALLVEGTGIDLTYNDGAGTLTIASTVSGITGTGITAVVALSQASYNAIGSPSATTLYLITG